MHFPCRLLVILIALTGTAQAIPTLQEVRAAYHPSDAVLLDRHQRVLHQLRVDAHGRRLEWTSLADVSPAMLSATLTAEDKRFYLHNGVDWKAIGMALFHTLFRQRPRGASTITMQLASLLDPSLRPHKRRRSLWQKWQQIQRAWELEEGWSKPEILEAYLNLVTFRGELQGIAAAARGLFGKDPHGLEDGEALILAALIRAPNASPTLVARRACWLNEALRFPIDCNTLTLQVRRVLSTPYTLRFPLNLAPHVATRLLRPYRPGERNRPVVSTLDRGVQRLAIEVLRQHLLSVRAQNVLDGAVLVVENRSGDILAYVGSSGDLASARHVDGVQARRQAGSTLKPFLYGLALEKRLLTPASLIEDRPLDVAVPGGVYRPGNYDNRFRGLVTVRTALASSLNVPAVRTARLVGIAPFLETLRNLGFQELRDADFYGPALALGSVDVSLWELVNAYRTLANGGMWSPLRLTSSPQKGRERRVFSPAVAFLISDILADRESRSETFGLESPLATRFWSAVKTGTSKDMRDNWCIGYSQHYTVGVWVGNFSGAPMWNVSGMTGAAPVWVTLMQWLHRNRPSSPPAPPDGLIRQEVLFPQLHSRRTEWFLAGTAPATVQQPAPLPIPRIRYPVSGMTFAIDPDIPRDQQRIFFTVQAGNTGLRWVLDEQDLGSATSPFPWSPRPGKHRLSLVDAGNRLVDTVHFTVKGGE